MMEAIILSAGRSERFFKPLYDKPKGLFKYHGECLIERQIKQLQEAGVNKITVVVGYEKEQYFFLQEKYAVELLINENYETTGSVYSLLLALKASSHNDVFVCCADHWYENNPFFGFSSALSVRLVSFNNKANSEFVVSESPGGRLSNLKSGAKFGNCMCGFAYFTQEFINKFCFLYELEKNCLGVLKLHWEQFWGYHTEELPLYGVKTPTLFYEFDSLDDLQKFDPVILDNLNSNISEKICKLVGCKIENIQNVVPLNRGLTNVSFSFSVGKDQFVYRYPGYSSSALVNRHAEVVAQKVAIDLKIDSSVIYIGEDGHKLSHWIDTERTFDYHNDVHLFYCVQAIKRFHTQAPCIDHSVNMLLEGDRFLMMASNIKGDLTNKYASIRRTLERLWHYTELDAWPKKLCHNDVYAVNWLVSAHGFYLIDWEYAAMNDPINDLATFIVRDSLDKPQITKVLDIYFDRHPNKDELRHCYAIFALCSWYWFCWSLFKDTLGEDGSFMLASYQGLKKYADLALSMYEQKRVISTTPLTNVHSLENTLCK